VTILVNTLPHRKPVQLAEHWCDVVASTRASDQPGGGILYRLQASHQLVGDAVVERITRVHSRRLVINAWTIVLVASIDEQRTA